MKVNLNTCLRGSTLIWYTIKLSDLEKAGLYSDPDGVEMWIKILTKWFKGSMVMALNLLVLEWYTVNDARNRRETTAYIQSIVQNAKGVELDSVTTQLTFA